MILTEEEAQTKWCPNSISYYQTTSGPVGINRDVPTGDIPACIASYCMYWRFIDPKPLRDVDLVTSDVVELPPRTGYCGIAGKPEHH